MKYICVKLNFRDMETKIVVMTEEQLNKLIESAKLNSSFAENQNRESKEYVYGLRGIRELFNVSHATAQRYKDTFLKDAIIQRGRKIMVDVQKAFELYNQVKV